MYLNSGSDETKKTTESAAAGMIPLAPLIIVVSTSLLIITDNRNSLQHIKIRGGVCGSVSYDWKAVGLNSIYGRVIICPLNP